MLVGVSDKETMNLFLYNSLSKRKEKFEPIEPPFVKIYHCGITPYDFSHVGHLRAEVAVDVLRRVLRFLGYYDIAISNFTDIDDKIIKRSHKENRDWREIPEEFIEYHIKVVRKINNLPYIVNPRVTEHITDIIGFVRELEKKGFAYKGNTGVYFDVSKFKDYGKLSGRKNPEAWEQEIEVLEDKKNPYDFALWKFKKPGEPFWDSPWGEGRPGWHIECSVMSSRYLGEQFDIHTGGRDLIFPHHENEIAQSEARFGKKPWVKYWIHIGLVTINKEKMSKSLGNYIPAEEFINKLGPMIARYYLITTHYREPLDINEQHIEQAKSEYKYIASTIKTLKNILKEKEYNYTKRLEEKQLKVMKELKKHYKEFIEWILNDIDTTEANKHLLSLVKEINKNVLSSEEFGLLYMSYSMLENINRIYGTWDEIFYYKKEKSMEMDLIKLLLDIRKELRKKKEFELADYIRKELGKIGIAVIDKGLESEWRLI